MNPEVGILILAVVSALSYPLVCAISCAIQSAHHSSQNDSISASPLFESLGW